MLLFATFVSTMRRQSVVTNGLAIAAALFIGFGCSEKKEVATETREQASAAVPERSFESAEAAFWGLEERILKAETVRVMARIQATGAVSASMDGTLLLQRENQANMDFAGVFQSKPVYLLLTSDGRDMRGGPTENPFLKETPIALRRGILIGLTRMGLLHNLAVLSDGRPPARTDGSIEQWARVANFKLGDHKRIGAVDTQAVEFDLFVENSRSAHCVLWLDLATGLPVQRDQVVSSSKGEMRVLELYEMFELDKPIPPQNFQHGSERE